MEARFVPYYDITETVERFLKGGIATNIHDALFYAIEDLGHLPLHYAFAEFGAYKTFVASNKELSEPSEDWQWEQSLFGLCTFVSKDNYLDFLKFCDERYA